MKPILIVYATREGHTHHIAEHMAGVLEARGHAAQIVDAADIPRLFSLDDYSAAILAASVHRDKHEAEMTEFVRRNRDALGALPTVFLSVSLSEAGAENKHASPESRAEAATDAHRMIEKFLKETGWTPGRAQAVAGALLYSQYNFLLRFVMKRIAKQAGGDTDTSRDYVYTDWTTLDELTDDVIAAARQHQLQLVEAGR